MTWLPRWSTQDTWGSVQCRFKKFGALGIKKSNADLFYLSCFWRRKLIKIKQDKAVMTFFQFIFLTPMGPLIFLGALGTCLPCLRLKMALGLSPGNVGRVTEKTIGIIDQWSSSLLQPMYNGICLLGLTMRDSINERPSTDAKCITKGRYRSSILILITITQSLVSVTLVLKS